MRASLLTATLVLLFCSADAMALQRPPALKPSQEWSGRSRDTAGKKLAPKNGVITNKKDWAKLWKAWRPDDKVPEINFRKQIVIVSTIGGPNRMFVRLSKDDKGNVSVLAGGTKIGGPGFGYHLAVIDRKGVKSVNGKPLGKGADPSKGS